VFRANLPRMRPADANAAFALYLERLEERLGRQTFFFGAAPRSASLRKQRLKNHPEISIHFPRLGFELRRVKKPA
jgi:hypothetical protein